MFDNFFEKFMSAYLDGGGYKLMVIGLFNTILIALCALVIGVFLGTIVAVIKVSPGKGPIKYVLDKMASLYITVIRGTPVLVQLLLVYFGISPFISFLHNISFQFSVFGILIREDETLVIAILVFGINSGAYVAEIVRSGIQAVEKGQMEAGRSLGLPYSITMTKIVLPQAIKNILPALANELIVLIKETSVASVITVFDLTKASRSVVANTYEAFVPYTVLAAVYLVLVLIASYFVKKLERRLGKSD